MITQAETISNAPRPNVMVGLTHTAQGQPVIRETKVLKVGIGHARGKACDVYVNGDGKWVVRCATEGTDRKLKFDNVTVYDTRAEAEVGFRSAWKKAPVCTYPRKTAYFNFTRPVMGDDGAQIYIPDFEAIEAHSFTDPNKPGPPTEIDIFFLDNEPLDGGFQNWAASELKCQGDGVNALRSISMAKTPEEQAAAKTAQAAGLKVFPIVDGCYTRGCPYGKETIVNGRTQPAPCGPNATIKFQLTRSMRVPGTAFFHTGSFRSIPQITSALERIKSLTNGRVSRIPLKMVVRSHKTNHNGQAAVQQNVSIEFRPEDMDHLRQTLLDQAWKFEGMGLGPVAPRMIDAPEDGVELMDDDGVFDDDQASDITAEPIETSGAAQATAAATADLSERLANAKRVEQPAAAPNLPWTDRNSMNSVFRAQRDRIGETRVNEICASHSVLLASVRPEDPKSMAIYQDMRASPAVEKKPRPEVPF